MIPASYLELATRKKHVAKIPQSQHSIFIRGFPAGMDMGKIREFFEREAGHCTFDFFKTSQDQQRLYVAIRFDSREIARDVISRFDNGHVMGHYLHMSWFKDIRRFAAYNAQPMNPPQHFGLTPRSSGGGGGRGGGIGGRNSSQNGGIYPSSSSVYYANPMFRGRGRGRGHSVSSGRGSYGGYGYDPLPKSSTRPRSGGGGRESSGRSSRDRTKRSSRDRSRSSSQSRSSDEEGDRGYSSSKSRSRSKSKSRDKDSDDDEDDADGESGKSPPASYKRKRSHSSRGSRRKKSRRSSRTSRRRSRSRSRSGSRSASAESSSSQSSKASSRRSESPVDDSKTKEGKNTSTSGGSSDRKSASTDERRNVSLSSELITIQNSTIADVITDKEVNLGKDENANLAEEGIDKTPIQNVGVNESQSGSAAADKKSKGSRKEKDLRLSSVTQETKADSERQRQIQSLCPEKLSELQNKRKELEQAYKQDCETFATVVKMLISKDPSLEDGLLSSLRESLKDIGQKFITELNTFVDSLLLAESIDDQGDEGECEGEDQEEEHGDDE